MKISILTPDVSHNCLGRAWLLAKILQRYYKVEIIGPTFGNGIWKPIADDKSVVYKTVKIKGMFKSYYQLIELTKEINGNVIYASKPLLSSFGIGLFEKLYKKIPLVLDIDDWQMGLMKESSKDLSFIKRFKYLCSSTLFCYRTNSYWNNLVGEKFYKFANEITVSNHFLLEKFGGTLVWHARDTDTFNPKKYNKEKLRRKYGIENSKKIVMYFGTPRAHKGVEDLIKSIELIEDRNVLLIIVGIDRNNDYCLKMVKEAKKRLGKERYIGFGLQPFENVPELLAIADIIVIPQRKNYASIGQVPAKIFDAMAMAKPIIGTNVSDLPKILEGCGWIVEPGNIEQLASTIHYGLNHSDEAKYLGEKARKECLEKYSWDSVGEILYKIFKKYQ